MKKNKMLIFIGIIFLFIGIFIYILSTHNDGNNIVYNYTLTKSDAEAIIKEKVINIIKLYETPSDTFKVENQEESEYYKVLNYEEIIKTLFSSNGQKELENTKFNDKNLVIKNDSNISFLKAIPQDNRYTDGNYSVDKIEIKDDTITAEVTISTYGLKDDKLSYYLYVKDIKLVKNNDDWLVDSFIYNN